MNIERLTIINLDFFFIFVKQIMSHFLPLSEFVYHLHHHRELNKVTKTVAFTTHLFCCNSMNTKMLVSKRLTMQEWTVVCLLDSTI